MIADVIITTWFIELSTVIVLSVILGFMLGAMTTLQKTTLRKKK
jgi:hypothetical protein